MRIIAHNLDSDYQPLFDAPNSKSELGKEIVEIAGHPVCRIIGELWTARQRQASSLHEVSYRACFKPQLPAYFIKRFTAPGDVVYDPFSGRGTTVIEAALWGRKVMANDANPLSVILARPRLHPPTDKQVEERLRAIPIDQKHRADIDLSMFYHPETEAELVSLRDYLRDGAEDEDAVDAWIRMIATNRLTGHSPGFFSVYTFPPNQAVSQQSQIKINQKRNQTPDYRDTRAIILKKTRQLLKGLSETDQSNLHHAAQDALFITGDAAQTTRIPDDTVQLTTTSPPFLDIVQYADDNWLRCWFNNLPINTIAPQITMARTVEAWAQIMQKTLQELYRITRPGGFVAFEVGEIRKGKIKLDEIIVPLGIKAGFICEAILINHQQFTKTANIWGVSNNATGTNSNRIVLFHKKSVMLN